MIKPEYPFKAIVRGFTVYGGDDPVLAMFTFETLADGAGMALGGGLMTYVMAPFAFSHMVPGQEGRPVIEAHLMGDKGGRVFIGALYGVPHETWRARERP